MLFSLLGSSNPTQGYSIDFEVENNDSVTPCNSALGEFIVNWSYNTTPPLYLVNGSLVKIEYSTDSGANWTTITSSASVNWGSYQGTVPSNLSSTWFRCTATYNNFQYAGSPETLTPPYFCPY